jgi:hypothetical protein
MRRDVLALVAQEDFAVLEADPGDSQTMTIRVFHVVNPHALEALRTDSANLLRVAFRGAPASGLPSGIQDPGYRLAATSEHEFRVFASRTIRKLELASGSSIS